MRFDSTVRVMMTMKKDPVKPEGAEYDEALKSEAEKVTGKIDDAFEKLANKLRGKAEKAKSKVDTTKHAAKRAVLLRRFELYADAANHLEDRLAHQRESPDTSSD